MMLSDRSQSFLSVFCCNCVSIWHVFLNITTFWWIYSLCNHKWPGKVLLFKCGSRRSSLDDRCN